MSSSALNDKANGSRLSRLLVDQGTEALRQVFDTHVRYSPSGTLPGVLSANKSKLRALRYKVVNSSQWKILYPKAGPPDTKNFDVTLLTILLREISGLGSPFAGWSTMPPDSDTSITADILRIKMFRNEVYAHVTTTEIDDSSFENLWEKISKALVALGIPSSDVDELKKAPLSPEEDGYIWQLEEWKKEEEKLIEISLDTNVAVKEILRIVTPSECKSVSDVDKLAKCDFTGNIRKLSSSFQEGTRTWLFEKLDSWFTDPDSKVMILTADPGIGKSVFAAKVCEIYQKSGKLAACHFCKFNNSDYSDPHTLLQSLASQMCDNVEGFKEKLGDQLRRSHSKEKLLDAFRVLLNDPLYALEERDPMMIVIDALDESTVEGKCELLELISEEFPIMPKWIKIFITSRPELPVQQKLSHLKPVEIRPNNECNAADLLHYFSICLANSVTSDEILSSLVWKCHGSFLYAYYTQLELREIKELTKDNLEKFAPKGLAGFYEKQFKRLQDEFAPLKLDVQRLINVLVASEGPLPLDLLRECLGLSKGVNFKLRKAVDEVMSLFLPVYDGCLTVYHKSLIDWLKADEHSFTADVGDGHRHLGRACESLFTDLMSLENVPYLKLTPSLKYASFYGVFHLIISKDWSKMHWLVDVKFNHINGSVFPRQFYMYLFNRYKSVSYLPEISNYLRCKIWRQDWLTSSDAWAVKSKAYYLQCVANGKTSINDEDDHDKSIAISILKSGSYVWCEDLNVCKELSNRLRMSCVPVSAQCIGISPNKQLAAVGDMYSATIVILELPNLEVLYEYESEMTDGVPCCTFSPDSSSILYGNLRSCLHVKDGKKMSLLSDFSGNFQSCSFSPSGSRLVTADGTSFVKLWDISKQKQLTCLDAGDIVDDCSFSQCGLFIFAKKKIQITEKYAFAIWNALTWQRVDRRYFSVHGLNQFSPFSGFEWIKSCTQSEQNSELVLSFKHSFIAIAFQLPYGFPICCLRGNFMCTVTRYKNRYCILTYEPKNKSFMITDPAERSVIAHRRVQWTFGPGICPIAMVEGFVIVSNTLHVLSFKAPDAISFIPPFHDVTITCCSFSPNGLSLATYDDYGIVRIWSVESCSVTQTYNMKKLAAIACWWSETSLWFVFSSCLAKIPVTAEEHVQFFKVEIMFFSTEYLYFQLLSFSEGVLILKRHPQNPIVVFQIINDKLQGNSTLPTTDLLDSASVGPGGRSILLASATKYQIWKVTKSDCPTWCLSKDVQLSNPPSTIEAIKCLITSDGVYGVIIYFSCTFGSNCVVIDLVTGEIQKRSSFLSRTYFTFEATYYAGSSFLVFLDEKTVYVASLQNYEIVALWSREGCSKSFQNTGNTKKSVLGFNSMYNLLAIPQRDGYINFVKIHGLERA